MQVKRVIELLQQLPEDVGIAIDWVVMDSVKGYYEYTYREEFATDLWDTLVEEWEMDGDETYLPILDQLVITAKQLQKRSAE